MKGGKNMYIILPFVGGLILFFLMGFIIRLNGVLLNKKFVDLGTLKGKKYSEIEKVVGKPNAVSTAKNGKIVRQWMRTGFHIALIFDENDVCEGVSHQSNT